jgi:hypothetical protein
MIQQTVFPFKIEITREKLTARGGLALMAEFNHGIGLMKLIDIDHIPDPDSTGDWCRRRGNLQTGQGEFYRECKARIPKGKRIGYYRADSTSYQAELINDLETDWG